MMPVRGVVAGKVGSCFTFFWGKELLSPVRTWCVSCRPRPRPVKYFCTSSTRASSFDRRAWASPTSSWSPEIWVLEVSKSLCSFCFKLSRRWFTMSSLVVHLSSRSRWLFAVSRNSLSSWSKVRPLSVCSPASSFWRVFTKMGAREACRAARCSMSDFCAEARSLMSMLCLVALSSNFRRSLSRMWNCSAVFRRTCTTSSSAVAKRRENSLRLSQISLIWWWKFWDSSTATLPLRCCTSLSVARKFAMGFSSSWLRLCSFASMALVRTSRSPNFSMTS
mmetsp:Transcript_17611/g.41816  ORF Transcript_17611/g.41816 Transcript_17611/m.41816 type:complete len:278 (+) Transcript_17611:143-976(+)